MTRLITAVNGSRFIHTVTDLDKQQEIVMTIPVSRNRTTTQVRVSVRAVDLPGETVQTVHEIVHVPTPPNPEDAIDVILKAIAESGDKAEAVRFWMTAITNQLTAILREPEDES